MQEGRRRVAILAGGGTLPVEFAQSLAGRGELAHVVALAEYATEEFLGFPMTRIGMGEIQRLLNVLRTSGATDIVLIGPVLRPDLRKTRLDLGFVRHLPSVLAILSSGGDDSLLSSVVRFFERQGFGVLGPADVAPETIAGKGPLGRLVPSAADDQDIALGFALVRALGDLDIGQAVAVRSGRIIGIEGAEGTDRMLERLARPKPHQTPAGAEHVEEPPSGVLVKRAKPGQELRVDMPSIGPQTVIGLNEAGLNGVAVHAGHVLIADRLETSKRADTTGVFVAGVDDGESHSHRGRQPDNGKLSFPVPRLESLTRRRPRRSEEVDIAWAATAQSRARPFRCGAVVVAAARHVLAVSSESEQAAAALERVWAWRSKGGTRGVKSSGVLAVASLEGLGEREVALARRAGLVGIAVNIQGYNPERDSRFVDACVRAGLYLVSMENG